MKYLTTCKSTTVNLLLHFFNVPTSIYMTVYAHFDRNMNGSNDPPTLYWNPRCNRERYNGSTVKYCAPVCGISLKGNMSDLFTKKTKTISINCRFLRWHGMKGQQNTKGFCKILSIRMHCEKMLASITYSYVLWYFFTDFSVHGFFNEKSNNISESNVLFLNGPCTFVSTRWLFRILRRLWVSVK